jgi:uncharacterized BrkB/YihY/UPF0761 family membrane protein
MVAVRSLSAVKRFLSEYLDSGASQYAGMLAFSLFVAMLPLTLGVLDFWGLFARTPRRGLYAARQVMIDMFPPATQNAVRQVVLQAGDHVGTVVLFALVGLIWFSTGVFSTMGFALNRIHGMPNRPMLQQRLRGLWLPLALMVAAYIAVVINVAVRLWSVPGVVVPVATWFTLAWLIGFLYRLAPSRMLTRAELIPGACLAALLIVGLGYAFPYYTQLTGGLSSGSRFFTVLFGLVAWVYGIAHAVLIGAVFNRTRMAAREEVALKALAAAVAREP